MTNDFFTLKKLFFCDKCLKYAQKHNIVLELFKYVFRKGKLVCIVF